VRTIPASVVKFALHYARARKQGRRRDRFVLGIAAPSPVFLLLAAALAGQAGAAVTAPDELSDLSLEELSNIKITSVSKRAERLSDAAASVYVITSEDIRRSGVNTLPEALRLAPNLEVARTSAGGYAISARGFNNSIGNKLLVLVDGRTVYTPLYSSVFWDAQDVMLEDVDRIEVISGPGATLWGANAVNGVINVITKPAQGTQGELAAAGGGNRETAGAVRHGGKLGEDGHYRIYANGYSEFSTQQPDGSSAQDRFGKGQIGFRADKGNAESNFTLQGDAYAGEYEPLLALGRPRLSGMNLLGRWSRQLGDGSSFQLQAYFDHTERDGVYTYRDRTDLADVEFQHGFALTPQQRLLWGGGYRYARDSTVTHFDSGNPLPEVFLPNRRSLDWSNLFVQDEIALHPNLTATLGMKVETNVYTGAEYLPSARLAWKPADNSLLWGAFSRAVRAPARLDSDFNLYLSLPKTPLIPVIKGGPDFQSEVAYVTELGYRAQPASTLSYSVTGFYSRYDRLRSGEPPPAFIQNLMAGPVYGVEAWGTWQAARNWRLSAGLVELRERIRILAGSTDPTGPSALGNDPKHQLQLRSSHDLPHDLELDLMLRHVGALPDPVVPAYTSLDARLGWHLNRRTDLSLTVQNLFNPRHLEFNDSSPPSEILRAAFVKLQWRN
jgi:iron complex outermembrane recepter protein